MRRLFLFWRQGGRDVKLLWRALKHPDRPTWLLPATVLLAFLDRKSTRLNSSHVD